MSDPAMSMKIRWGPDVPYADRERLALKMGADLARCLEEVAKSMGHDASFRAGISSHSCDGDNCEATTKSLPADGWTTTPDGRDLCRECSKPSERKGRR